MNSTNVEQYQAPNDNTDLMVSSRHFPMQAHDSHKLPPALTRQVTVEKQTESSSAVKI